MKMTIQEFAVPDGDVIQVPWHDGTEVIGNYVRNERDESLLMDANAVPKVVSQLFVIAQFSPDAPQRLVTLVKLECGMLFDVDEGVTLRHLCTWYNSISRKHVVLALLQRPELQGSNVLAAVTGEIDAERSVQIERPA